ncbi:MAG: hypothetical protein ABIQ02_05920 [Saprospiraceae bacterium]
MKLRNLSLLEDQRVAEQATYILFSLKIQDLPPLENQRVAEQATRQRRERSKPQRYS